MKADCVTKLSCRMAVSAINSGIRIPVSKRCPRWTSHGEGHDGKDCKKYRRPQHAAAEYLRHQFRHYFCYADSTALLPRPYRSWLLGDDGGGSCILRHCPLLRSANRLAGRSLET